MARNGEKKTQKQKSLPFIQPDAAGIDIGATEWLCPRKETIAR
jgi:hypothetical protein